MLAVGTLVAAIVLRTSLVAQGGLADTARNAGEGAGRWLIEAIAARLARVRVEVEEVAGFAMG